VSSSSLTNAKASLPADDADDELNPRESDRESERPPIAGAYTTPLFLPPEDPSPVLLNFIELEPAARI
jgi:hypothetical protein